MEQRGDDLGKRFGTSAIEIGLDVTQCMGFILICSIESDLTFAQSHGEQSMYHEYSKSTVHKQMHGAGGILFLVTASEEPDGARKPKCGSHHPS